jgi:hypothetical protein
MNDRPARIFAQYLVDQGVGVFSTPTGTGWGVVAGPQPVSTHDRWVSVQDTGAVVHGRLHTGDNSQTQTVIVTVRGTLDADVAWDKCVQVEGLCNPVGVITGTTPSNPTVVVGGNTYRLKGAHVYIPPTPMGREEQSNRWLYSVNVRLSFAEGP